MAEVFLATHTGPHGFHKRVAIKRILPHLAEDDAFVSMFLDEVRLAAKFSHPHIVQIFELGEHEGRHFAAMEYVPGVSLARVLKECRNRHERLPIPLVVRVAADVCSALEYAHTFVDTDGRPLNLVHRDVSPQNVMWSYDGVIKVLDFGIAKAASNWHLTETSTLKGKLAYMSPEQVRRNVALDHRSDLFSLGVVLFQALLGCRPFRGNSEIELITALANDPVADPREIDPSLPEPLVAVLLRALEKDRDRRYRSAREMQQDLEEFLNVLPSRPDAYALGRYVRELLPPDADVVSTPPRVDPPVDRLTEKLTPPTPVPVRSSGSVPILARASGPVSTSSPASASASLPMTALEPLGIDVDMSISSDSTVSVAGRPRRRWWWAAPVAVGLSVVAVLWWWQNDRSRDQVASSALGATLTDVPGVADAAPAQTPAPSPDAQPTIDARAMVAGVFDAPAVEPRPPDDDHGHDDVRDPNEDRHPPAKQGWLTVDTRPWTEVIVDGKKRGQTPLSDPIAVRAGRRKVILVNRDEGIRFRTTVVVREGQTEALRKKFVTGALEVLVQPYGDVFVDGKRRGITPLDQALSLYEGAHTVRVFCDLTGKSETQRVTIAAGKTRRVKFDLR